MALGTGEAVAIRLGRDWESRTWGERFEVSTRDGRTVVVDRRERLRDRLWTAVLIALWSAGIVALIGMFWFL